MDECFGSIKMWKFCVHLRLKCGNFTKEILVEKQNSLHLALTASEIYLHLCSFVFHMVITLPEKS